MASDMAVDRLSLPLVTVPCTYPASISIKLALISSIHIIYLDKHALHESSFYLNIIFKQESSSYFSGRPTKTCSLLPLPLALYRFTLKLRPKVLVGLSKRLWHKSDVLNNYNIM